MWLSRYFSIAFLLWLSDVHCGDPPKLLKEVKRNYTARVGSAVKLKCVVSGTKNKIDVRTLTAWKKSDYNGTRFVRALSGKRFRTKLGRYLKIRDVQPEDAGTYICIARNPFGQLKEDIQLTVIAANSSSTAMSPITSTSTDASVKGWTPRFRKVWPESRRIITSYEGESLKLKCQASGNPKPDINWKKDGRKLSKVQRSYRVSGGAVLSFQYLLPSDAGTYTCTVNNPLGSINRTFVVRVFIPTIATIKLNKAEVMTDRLQNKTVFEEDDVAFTCATMSVDQPDYGWLKWDRAWTPMNLTKRHPNPTRVKPIKGKITFVASKAPEGRKPKAMGVYIQELRIANVSLSDAGKYTCHVRHSGGFASGSVFLVVQPKGDRESDDVSTADPQAVRGKTSYTKIPLFVFIVMPLPFAAVVAVVAICCYVQNKRRRLQLQRQTEQSTSTATHEVPSHKWCLKHRLDTNTYVEHPGDTERALERDFSVEATVRSPGFDELITHRTSVEGLHSENRCCQHSSCTERSSESLSSESKVTTI